MEQKYFLAKKLVNQKFPNGSGIDGFLILGLYGLLCVYKNHQNIVSKAFLGTDILYEKGTISEILDRHNIDFAEYKYSEKDESRNHKNYSVSNHGTFIYLEDGKLKIEKCTPFIAASIDHIGITGLLNSFIYEMGHIIKRQINGYSSKMKENKMNACVRSGLCVDTISYNCNGKIYYEYKIREALDEAINTLQTTEAMKKIKALGESISDGDVKNVYNMLNKQLLLEDFGYRKTIKALRPLWENNAFRKLIEDNIIEGKLSTIRRTFDSSTYKGAFNQLANLLDDIDELEYSGGDFIIELITNLKIKKIINKFKKNKSFQKKKWTFQIKRFLLKLEY